MATSRPWISLPRAIFFATRDRMRRNNGNNPGIPTYFWSFNCKNRTVCFYNCESERDNSCVFLGCLATQPIRYDEVSSLRAWHRRRIAKAWRDFSGRYSYARMELKNCTWRIRGSPSVITRFRRSLSLVRTAHSRLAMSLHDTPPYAICRHRAATPSKARLPHVVRPGSIAE